MTTGAEALAGFTAGLTWEQVPQEVRESVKLRILDILGLCLAGSRMEFFKAVRGAVAPLGGAPAGTVIGTEVRLSAPMAALVNGTACHGLDFDDTHSRAVVHASACVVPAALALAEAEGRSGMDLIVAAAAGYEAITRLGSAAPGKFHERGFHATSIAGTFAAALLAGKLLGMDADRMVNSMGIAGSQASGILEFLEDGSWVKRLHPGWAAMSGIMAALLAREGMSGPKSILEGRFGLYQTHVGRENFDPAVIAGGLGERWETLNISYKPYPCCHFIHAFLDCVAGILLESPLEPDDIAGVVCRAPAGIVPFVLEPAAAKLRPRTDYEAKFSLQYSVAAMICRGRVDIDTFEEPSISDPRILGLAERVRYEIDPDTAFPRFFPGWVIILTRDGERREKRVPFNRGGPGNPMKPSEIKEKFRANASGALSPVRVEAVLETVERLETLGDAGELARLCSG